MKIFSGLKLKNGLFGVWLLNKEKCYFFCEMEKNRSVFFFYEIEC